LNISFYWHTLRHLKFIQFYWRIRIQFYRRNLNLDHRNSTRQPSKKLCLNAQKPSSLTGPVTFNFLNESHSLENVTWGGKNIEKLWLYNLHYFDDLNAINNHDRLSWHVELLNNWIEINSPGVGCGWDSYPTSLRIVNWIKWQLYGNKLPENCMNSLVIQCRWLSNRIEWHLLGNHLLANAKALIFSGLFFQGKEANYFLKKGLRIINSQLTEQVLQDGGNFERSTMYHNIILEDILDLINVAKIYPECIDVNIVEGWMNTAARMLRWMKGMLHPDGQIGLFNDAAFNITPSPKCLHEYSGRLGIEIESHNNLNFDEGSRENRAYCNDESSLKLPSIKLNHFSDSGYIRMEGESFVALLDVAPVGPDYLPAHAHADTLSFELSIFKQRIIVNGGTSCYGLSHNRLKERQTSSHSTVEIDGESSSEVWSSFRVAQRAFPFDLNIAQNEDITSVSCAHNGYKRLVGKPIHRREWEINSKGFFITDQIEGDFENAIARFIFHPNVKLVSTAENKLILQIDNDEKIDLIVHAGKIKIKTSNYAPEFGKILKTQCLEVELINGYARTQLLF